MAFFTRGMLASMGAGAGIGLLASDRGDRLSSTLIGAGLGMGAAYGARRYIASASRDLSRAARSAMSARGGARMTPPVNDVMNATGRAAASSVGSKMASNQPINIGFTPGVQRRLKSMGARAGFSPRQAVAGPIGRTHIPSPSQMAMQMYNRPTGLMPAAGLVGPGPLAQTPLQEAMTRSRMHYAATGRLPGVGF